MPQRQPNPTVVLLHGVGLDHGMWEPCSQLLPGSVSVVAPDLLGHGRARKVTEPLRLVDFADDVMTGLSGPVHLVGFSLGALVAQRLSVDHPESVRSLTLISSVARRSAQQRSAVQRRLRAAREDPQGNIDVALERWTGGDPDRLAPEVVRYVRATLSSIDRDSFVAAYDVFARADQELEPMLATITAPTLAVTGGDDPGSTAEMSRQLAAMIPGARAVVLDGARHLLPLERPPAVADLILDHVRSNDGHS
jgi:(E)-2-((N-methylformamido)methylene)succinate hydrolase